MESLAALGLASNIIDLIGVFRSVTSTIKEIQKSASGSSKDFDQFRHFASLVRRDVDLIIADAKNDREFQQYARSLRDRMNTYLAELDDCKVKDPKSWLQA
ncbi:hypothetical protein K505DRAFT_359886 [Melanomma pulvis-pyrius CBS 109.77]|uniref:Uncharacterized protein n=1 Tax=Melanomma pulvis-pyrius CBS 109.77 TaxID=1314802 RepID=A0A6A6XJP4_9PLEO|nr:hypothetical protein K505DRAFT_359886 [Melanomma pulvis-pyrius CBS 109.77]